MDCSLVRASMNFNPRAPYGARLYQVLQVVLIIVGFQSTRPIRGATTVRVDESYKAQISIHAPHTGRDRRKK